MDAIERAIRSALAKGDAADRSFRERVYRQAFAALERALQANPGITVETAIRRRKGLQDKITEIEAEYIPRPAGAAPVAVAPASPVAADLPPAPREPTVEVPPPHQDHIDVAPHVSVETRGGAIPVVPDIMVETPAESAPVPDIAPSRPMPPKRRSYARLASAIIVLCLLAMGGWWAYSTGLVGKKLDDWASGIDTVTPSEDYDPGADQAPGTAAANVPDRKWINVFAPSDPATVSTPGDAKAEVAKDSLGPFMRIQSGASGSAVLFDIGQGVLQQIAGKKATFDIVARSQEGQETEITVACNFGELGDCGRKRYEVGTARGDYLFEVNVPQGEPGAGGTIAINSDFSNGGKSVDIFEIRVSTDQPEAAPAATQ